MMDDRSWSGPLPRKAMSTICGEIRGAKASASAAPHADDPVGTEQQPGANGQQDHHAAGQHHRLQQVPQLVPPLLGRVERRKTMADHDVGCEHLIMEAAVASAAR